MNNHFNRTARLGASVLINERWYKMVNIHYNLRFDHFEIQAGGFFYTALNSSNPPPEAKVFFE